MMAALVEVGVYICARRGAIGWRFCVWAHAVVDWIAVGSNRVRSRSTRSQPPTRTNKQTPLDPVEITTFGRIRALV